MIFSAGKPKKEKLKVNVKIRHRFPDCLATLEIEGENGSIAFKTPQRAVTQGQSAVFYKGTKVLGGGEILNSP